MAVDGVFLGTHQRYGAILRSPADSGKPFLEERRVGDGSVVHPTVSIARILFAARPKLTPQKHVVDSAILQGLPQRFTIELRIEAAVRARTHVRDRLYPVAAQNLDKPTNLMGGVTHGEQSRPV